MLHDGQQKALGVLRVPGRAVVRRLHALPRDQFAVVAGLQARAVVLAVAPVVRGIKSHGHERLAVRGRAGRPAVVRRRERKILHELVTIGVETANQCWRFPILKSVLGFLGFGWVFDISSEKKVW